jgi:polysaccharide export outer membrane protein
VTVRPDGRITLPLINDVVARGLTPDQLRDQLKAQFDKFVEDSSVSVVKQINSRKVFITGMVGKPGAYPLTSTMTVLQLISMAGGINEFARAKEIVVMRTENGAPKAIKFNYEEVRKGKKLQQNIELRPSDTVLVP